ncbi:MAG: hypothetical protein KDI44_14595, partial [Thiothrix sp.]|nr:hypothetical protein [Thiothrix sp.]
MAISDTTVTYVGISNENEFYSQHYLSQIFAGDIKDVLNRWAQAEEQAPYQHLRNLNREYFPLRERLRRERKLKPARRLALQRTFLQTLLAALGYPFEPHNTQLDKGQEIPLLATLGKAGNSPELWVLEAFDAEQEGTDPLALTPQRAQFAGEVPPDPAILQASWNALITKWVFAGKHPPRWVLLLSERQLLLLDRLKWNQNRLLRFDWEEILGRRDLPTLKATAALLHRDSLLPEDGLSLLDTLDENAHKHAFAVSEDLKYALRESIELLGNEAAAYLLDHTKIGYTGKHALDAGQLSLECLRYMYRLLFLFYIEARPELGYVPHQSDAYRKGYSLEALRDLEMVQLTSEESRNGSYIHESLQRLFSLIHHGYQGENQSRIADTVSSVYNSFNIEPLDSHLFDPARTRLLNKVVFRNETLQRIIRLMSLTRPQARQRRGRVSYAQLGINQLGAVYEALLSYRGFFADRDLYEVKKAGTEPDELETGYFVPAEDIELYTEDERVYGRNAQGHKALRKYEKGTFIYRLAGRDRQKSASYYTPEVLTQTLVKYALKELLAGKTADEILRLTICEPAMGSAAFINEAVNQLAQAYLERKQAELQQHIPHEEYSQRLQQVKMFIADRNTFGVDLNPVAVELAEVSLWLNAIHGERQVPWFGYQLFNGNSLIGARRQVYDIKTLRKPPRGVPVKAHAWYGQAPLRLHPGSLGGKIPLSPPFSKGEARSVTCRPRPTSTNLP